MTEDEDYDLRKKLDELLERQRDELDREMARAEQAKKTLAAFLKRTGMDKMANNKDKAVYMPPQYIKERPREFHELAIGESGFVHFTCIRVDEEGRVFIHGGAFPELEAKKDKANFAVRREPEGFVLLLDRNDKSRWERKPIANYDHCYPVIKIEQEP